MPMCVLEGCEAPHFIIFESPDLGDRQFPLCKGHFDEHFVDRSSVERLKALLRALTFQSTTAPPIPQPKEEEPKPKRPRKPPTPPPPKEEEEDEDMDDWEANMFGGTS